MARKLYIFDPVGRSRADWLSPERLVGGFSSDYLFLGDLQARMLGVGNNVALSRAPRWLHTSSRMVKLRGRGASRADAGFRGWG